MDDREGPPDPLVPGNTEPFPRTIPQSTPLPPVTEAVSKPVDEHMALPRTAAGTAPTSNPYAPKFGSLGSYYLGRLIGFALDAFGIAFVIATFMFNVVLSHVSEADAAPLLVFGISLAAMKSALGNGFIVIAAISLVLAFFIMWISETIFGTTLGKLLFGLAIRRSLGGRAGPGRIFTRSLLRPIDALVIGAILALVTPKHQRIGDLMGGTIVVRSPLGFFATIIAACGFIAIGYAQIAFGGGIGSAAGVIAQSAVAIPHLIGQFGGPTPLPGATVVPSSLPSVAPSMLPTAVATPPSDPTAAPTEAPTPI